MLELSYLVNVKQIVTSHETIFVIDVLKDVSILKIGIEMEAQAQEEGMKIFRSKLRHLDVDDLIIIYRVGHYRDPLSHLAQKMGLTPPAVTHRMNKHRELFKDIYKSELRKVCLTDNGKLICDKISLALENLEVI